MYQVDFLTIITTPPGSMIFVILMGLTTTLISQLLTRWLVDTEEIERKQKQIRAHEEDKEKIIKLADIDVNRYKKQRKRWERKDVVLKKSQQSISMTRMKPMCITFIPMMVIFGFVGQLFNSAQGTLPVAMSPMNPSIIPFLGDMIMATATSAVAGTSWISFTGWYMLCSLGFNSVIPRLFKTTTQTTGGGFSQMMSGQKSKALEFPDV
jgi:uncharacterized membrane protein (DUF106 family)